MRKVNQLPGYPTTDIRNRIIRMLSPPQRRPAPTNTINTGTLRIEADRVICLPLGAHRCPIQSSITECLSIFGITSVGKSQEVDVIDFLLHVWLEAKVPIYYITVSSEKTNAVKIGYDHMRSQAVECLVFPFDRITDSGLTESCYTELQKVGASVLAKIPSYPNHKNNEEEEEEKKKQRKSQWSRQNDPSRVPPSISEMYAPFTETNWPVFVINFCHTFGRPVTEFGGATSDWMEMFCLANTCEHIHKVINDNFTFMNPPFRHRPQAMFTPKALTVSPDEACLLTSLDSKAFNACPNLRSVQTRPGAAICRPCIAISEDVYFRVHNDVSYYISDTTALVRCGINPFLWGHHKELKESLRTTAGNAKFAIITDYLKRYTTSVGLKHEGFRDMLASLKESGMDPEDYRPDSEGVRFMKAFNSKIDGHSCPSTMSKLIMFIKSFIQSKGLISSMTHVRVALLALATCIRGLSVHEIHQSMMSMFVIITGPPGYGKSAIVTSIRSLLPASAVYQGTPTVASLSRSAGRPTGAAPKKGSHHNLVGMPDDVKLKLLFSASENIGTMLELISNGTTARSLVEDQSRIQMERAVINGFSVVYCTNDTGRDGTALGDRMIVASIKQVVLKLTYLKNETTRFAHERTINEFRIDKPPKRKGRAHTEQPLEQAEEAEPDIIEDDDDVDAIAETTVYKRVISPHYVFLQNLSGPEHTVKDMAMRCMRSVFEFACRIAFVSNLLGGQNTRMEEIYMTILNTARRRVNARAVTNESQLQRNLKCLLWSFTLYNTITAKLVVATLAGRHNNRLHFPSVADVTDEHVREVMPLVQNIITVAAVYTCDLPCVMAASTICSISQTTANMDIVLEKLSARAMFQSSDSAHPKIHRMDSGYYVELEKPPSTTAHMNVFLAMMGDADVYVDIVSRLALDRTLILGLQGEPMMHVEAYYSARQWPECISELRTQIFKASAPCLKARYHECMVAHPMSGSVEYILVPRELALKIMPSYDTSAKRKESMSKESITGLLNRLSARGNAVQNITSTVEWLRFVAHQSSPWVPPQKRVVFAPSLAVLQVTNCLNEYVFADLPDIFQPVYTRSASSYRLVPNLEQFYSGDRESDGLRYRAWDRDLLPDIYIQAMSPRAGKYGEIMMMFSPQVVLYPQAIAGTMLAQAQSYDGLLHKVPGFGKCVNLETNMTNCPTHEHDMLIDNARAGMVLPEHCGIYGNRSPYEYPTKPTHLIINAYTSELMAVAAMYANKVEEYVDLAWPILNGDVNAQTSQRSESDEAADVVLPPYFNPCGRIQKHESDILHHSQMTYMLMVCHHLARYNVRQVAVFEAFATAIRAQMADKYLETMDWLYRADACVYRLYDMPDSQNPRPREPLWAEMGLTP